MIEQEEEKTRKQQPEDEDESMHSASEVEIVPETTKHQTTQTGFLSKPEPPISDDDDIIFTGDNKINIVD
ncbi:hypothetical protein AVEN_123479-1, partial [Araneus ventricosus]